MRRRCQNHQGGNRHGQEEEEEQDAVWGKHLTRCDNFSPQGALNVYWYGFYGEFSHGQPQSELTLIRHSTSIIREGEIWYGGWAAEGIFLDRVKSCSYDERNLLPLQLVLLLPVVLVAPLLVLINGRGDFLQHPEHPRLHAVHYKNVCPVCNCVTNVTIMSLPLFSGSRSQEWTLLSVTVCPLLYPHSCPGISIGIFLYSKGEERWD